MTLLQMILGEEEQVQEKKKMKEAEKGMTEVQAVWIKS